MALTWPQYGPNHVIVHYFSVVLLNLFSKNLNHFRNLKAKMWPRWSEHGPNMGQILGQYPLNNYTLLVLTCLKCMLFQPKNQPIQTPKSKDDTSVKF